MTTHRPTLIYRITHLDNLAWILDHGLHCETRNRDPDLVGIGLPDLIEKRRKRQVRVGPCGALSDYVPFYFGTHSLMLYNIHTGYRVDKVEQRSIIYLVSSVERVQELGVPFVFTDRHAYPVNAKYFTESSDLQQLDWALIRGRNFKRDPEQPDKIERRAAEFLIYGCLPVDGLLGVACYDKATDATIEQALEQRQLALRVKVRREWYF